MPIVITSEQELRNFFLDLVEKELHDNALYDAITHAYLGALLVDNAQPNMRPSIGPSLRAATMLSGDFQDYKGNYDDLAELADQVLLGVGFFPQLFAFCTRNALGLDHATLRAGLLYDCALRSFEVDSPKSQFCDAIHQLRERTPSYVKILWNMRKKLRGLPAITNPEVVQEMYTFQMLYPN